MIATEKPGGGPALDVQSHGTGIRHTAYGQTNEKGAVFRKAGQIEKVHGAVRLVFTSFRTEHRAYISCLDLQRLLRDRYAIVEVVRIRDGIDGEPVVERIGTAARSRSGKALMVRTVNSDGELVASWENFQGVVRGERSSSILSRLLVAPGRP